MTKVVFRVDGDAVIGLGHIVRCVALAKMLQQQFLIEFAIIQPSENIVALVRSKMISLIELPACDSEDVFLSYVKQEDIVILDGYHFTEIFQLTLRDKVCRLVIIDDLADKKYYADLILNHGGKFLEREYKVRSSGQVLLGFDYALVRNEFLACARNSRHINKIETGFVCMGGADPHNLTGKVLKAMIRSGVLRKVYVVTGGAYQYLPQLQELMKSSSGVKIIHENNIGAERMVSILQDADVAICPSSSIAIEAVCVKIGLITGTFIANQQQLHQQLIHQGCAVSVGDFNKVAEEELISTLKTLAEREIINQQIQHQAVAIDGYSNERIVNAFKALAIC